MKQVLKFTVYSWELYSPVNIYQLRDNYGISRAKCKYKSFMQKIYINYDDFEKKYRERFRNLNLRKTPKWFWKALKFNENDLKCQWEFYAAAS